MILGQFGQDYYYSPPQIPGGDPGIKAQTTATGAQSEGIDFGKLINTGADIVSKLFGRDQSAQPVAVEERPSYVLPIGIGVAGAALILFLVLRKRK